MLPARPSRERPVSAQGGLGFVSLSVGQRVPLRILYGVSSFESGKDYLLVSYHLVPTLAMRGMYYSLRLQPQREHQPFLSLGGTDKIRTCTTITGRAP